MKLNTILPIALLMMATTACQNDNEPNLAYPSDPDAVRVNPTITELQSRVNTLAEGNKWTEGDQIKVALTSSDAVEGKDVAVYKYTKSAWNLQGDNYMAWPSHNTSKRYNFEAYYPYTTGSSTSFSKFVLPSNQSNATVGETFIGNADWMIATATSAKVDKVDLTFNHLMAKVSVTIKEYRDQYAENLPTISEPQFALPTTRTSLQGKVVSVQGNANTIKGLMQSDNSAQKHHTFTAIVMPGKYKSSDDFLTLNVNGKPLYVKVGSNAVLSRGLESGKAYIFNLTMGKRGFSIGNVTINDWGKSDWSAGEHGGTAEEIPAK